uniref:Uncharacterized protein n=1 Tax=Arundo donax TaxID=35708 RepID=A0A0A8ZEP6_ARUDO
MLWYIREITSVQGNLAVFPSGDFGETVLGITCHCFIYDGQLILIPMLGNSD